MKIENYDMATVLMHKVKDATANIKYIKDWILDRKNFDIIVRMTAPGFDNELLMDLDDEFKNEILLKCIEKNKKWIEEWTSILDSL